MGNLVEHMFVLMLENRAFDHMLGFSGITGHDAAKGGSTQINGLTGSEVNSFNGGAYQVSRGADEVMPADPGHEFNNVLEQLCGPRATYQASGAYPAINNTGFVASYVGSGGAADPGEVMKCFAPEQLPFLVALAQEFALCDNWHASMPGPTWPNRMFVHAASSGGLDHSPTTEEIVEWETIGGFQFKAGSIFDALKKKAVSYRLYAGDDFPMVAALKGISLFDIRHYSNFASELAESTYPYNYVFIEPSYDVLNDYKNSTSQHPLTDITLGERLIKETYETIRNSPHWNSSVLIMTWDEHGGFFDHAIPPGAVAPGDTAPQDKHTQYGFTFQQYGPRVAAVVISPLVAKNTIDHRLYDHASIPATTEALFAVNPLTQRDAKANRLDALLSLNAPRPDTPTTLPFPANAQFATAVMKMSVPDLSTMVAVRPDATVDQGTLPVILHSALRQDLEMSPEQRTAILQRVRSIKTREQARQYLAEVQKKLRDHRAATHTAPGSM
ncbi:MAG: alkaline phosphatase family protein [Candidatus Sulfotelmatobacter sp.]|jgi:phospholipase C